MGFLVGLLGTGTFGSFVSKYFFQIILAVLFAAGTWFIWNHYTTLVKDRDQAKAQVILEQNKLLLKQKELEEKQKQLELSIEVNKRNESVIKDLQAANALNKKLLAQVRTALDAQRKTVASMQADLAKIKEVAPLTPPLRFAVREMNRLQQQNQEDLGLAPKSAPAPTDGKKPEVKPDAKKPEAKKTTDASAKKQPSSSSFIEWSNGSAKTKKLTDLKPNGATR